MDGQEGSPILSPQLDGAHRQSPQLEVVLEEGQMHSSDMSSTVTPDTVTSAPDTAMNDEGVPIESPEASAAATLASVANSVANSAAQAAVPSPVPAIPNPLPPGYNKDQPICANCSTQTTPLWRRSHDSTHILCNACALFFKMKGRPRPISLKTDVIKSRNRSKGKSTSKDRGGSGALVGGHAPRKQDRGESTSRSREEGKVGKKSAPGGADVEEDELEDGRSSTFGDGYSDAEMVGRKARKMTTSAPYGMPMPGYAGHFPYPYPYPHPHPHAHQPYPPRARSRSSSSSRRATSLDARPPSLTRQEGAPGPPPPQNGASYAYPPPPPGYHPGQPGLHAEGYYPYYGYPGYPPPPGQSYYPPGGPAYAQAQAQAHALSRQAPSITHAQSDSRSKSETDSPRSSASPPNAAAAAAPPSSASGLASYYPHPNPNYPHQPPGPHHPYSHSPLSSSVGRPSTAKADEAKESSNGRVTLAPMQTGGGTPRSLTPDVHLPSIGSVANGGSAAPPSPTSHVPRHTALFSARYPSADDKVAGVKLAPDERSRRRTSVSSNSASVSDSSDGVRSPETNGRVDLPWVAPWAPEDERRGRSPHRYEDLAAAASLAAVKGKGREFEEFDELEEDEAEQGSRMVGVEAGLGELRVVDSHSNHPKTSSSSRSRSSGHGGPEERGRPRSAYARGRSQSQSTSRARAGEMRSPSAASSSGRFAAQEAEIARLKNKVAELTFLNGLMQSRLGQLEAPGRVPHRTLTSMTAATPRPYPDMMEEEDEDEVQEEGEVDDELGKFGVKAQDPAVRASLLQFFRQQGGGHASSH